MELFADIIIDISHSKLDQTFSYRVPECLQARIEPGNVVQIPFGRGDRLTRGYVLRISDHTPCPSEKIKDIAGIETDLVGSDSRLTALALWMRDYYGSTTVQALRTALPFRQKAAEKKKRTILRVISKAEAEEKLLLFRKKHQTARARLMEALVEEEELPYELVTGSLKITSQAIKTMEEQGIIRCESQHIYRTPAVLRSLRDEHTEDGKETEAEAIRSIKNGIQLNNEQQYIVDEIFREWTQKEYARYLIHGVTGSGKTAVYLELIAKTLAHGKQAILLIPEISLTYQNVIRFYQRFGDRISILHSRLSPAERYDQFERARSGDIDVMIGPRSALFTPFQHLGMIIIDEEHEASYKSETVPRYQAAEVAWKRAKLEHACLVLGSATPSLEAFYQAQSGESRLFKLEKRATGGCLPEVEVVDLREELRGGNRSMLSRSLHDKLEKCLQKGQQAMLFLNRRGYSGFVSCRSCGHVIKCPHCDVSLSLHRGNRLVCHYCGYEEPMIKKCPDCESSYIGAFKAGTQQIEMMVLNEFPQARVLRMDADTTRGKDGHAEILRSFGAGEADILIGTQMIVKGHDFPNVTLVGILAADLSLNISDYQAAERTFQLLTQAAGRAGRGSVPGQVVIQTYEPGHYAVTCAAAQDYARFYEEEIRYRTMAGYPPVGDMMAIHCSSENQQQLEVACDYLNRFIRQLAGKQNITVIGPADEAVAKINDVYRKALYLKHSDVRKMTGIKNIIEQYIEINTGFKDIRISFERR